MAMLEILYHDPDYVAIHKPSGLLVHPSRISSDRVCAMTQLRDQLGQWVYPVHRLDRQTSGVLLFALSSEAARAIQETWERREVRKTYLAVVRGWAPERGEIDHPLKQENSDTAVPSLTRFGRLATAELPHPVGRYPTARFSLVRAEPVTGRIHQIRRHLAHLSHPIVGDVPYGDGKQNRFFREHFDLRRLLLMAQELEFDHPTTRDPIQIHAALPPDVAALFQKLGWPAC
jgi:tRNA pseudouridine65 synthase